LRRRAAEVSARKIRADTEAGPSADIESIRAGILTLRAVQVRLFQNQTSTIGNLGDVRGGLYLVRNELRDLTVHVGKLVTLLLQLAPPEDPAT